MAAHIVGTGSELPPFVISNKTIGALVERYQPGKGAAWAEEKLGIQERRFMSPLDPATGHPVESVDEIAIAEGAARRALTDAGMPAKSVAALWYVTCTQPEDRQHFGAMAHELHRRLELPRHAITLELDAGCGGALHAMTFGSYLLAGSGRDNILIVASNGPSRFYDNWETYVHQGAWLSMYIFGDGAGAVLLRKGHSFGDHGILASFTAVDPTQTLMEYGPRMNGGPSVYYIDGRAVAASFAQYARDALAELRTRWPFEYADISRFYFHQVNGRVLAKFVADQGIPKEKVAVHVDRYGNIAAAATLVLLDEDRRAGVVKSGDLCVFCTVGAGVQYGAMLVRL